MIEVTKEIIKKIKYLYLNNWTFKSQFIFRGRDYHEVMREELKQIQMKLKEQRKFKQIINGQNSLNSRPSESDGVLNSSTN